MAPHDETESLRIAQEWLDRLSFSAATWNFPEHMALISRQVQVLGLPKGIVDYAGFKRRRYNEFTNKLLLSLTYKELLLLEANDGQITFAVKEIVKSTRGENFILDKEVMLQREIDGEWRAVLDMIKSIARK